MKGGRWENNKSGHNSSKSGDWQHDKFQETENSKSYKSGYNSGGNQSQNSNNFRNHKTNSGANQGSKGGGKGSSSFGNAWTHDKFDSFEKGFGKKRHVDFKKKNFPKRK